ncbi:MAG: NADH-quinone oxidoreductase subunit J family protein [Thermoanaerobaculia bacterium]
MDNFMAALPAVLFFVVGAVAIAASVLVVAMRNPVHSALFLLLTFLAVAVLFISMGAEFVGAVQVLVYAGGIMVLFLFVVMLINVRQLPEERVVSRSWKGGLGIGIALLLLFGTIVARGVYHGPIGGPDALRTVPSVEVGVEPEVAGNTEAVGMMLYREYLVPFEVASLFLLVAMIGAIVIGKRELSAIEEEAQPQFILDRAKEEKKLKEAVGA